MEQKIVNQLRNKLQEWKIPRIISFVDEIKLTNRQEGAKMKTIIVTGDSRGLGNNITETLLKDGYRVVGISRKESDEIINLKKNMKDMYMFILI